MSIEFLAELICGAGIGTLIVATFKDTAFNNKVRLLPAGLALIGIAHFLLPQLI